MTYEQIIELVIQILPSVIAFCTTVGMIIKTVKEFAVLRKEVANMKSIEDLKADLGKVIEENYQLKKTLNDTMTKIDHIERK